MCDEYEKEALRALEEVDRREAEEEEREGAKNVYEFFMAVCRATHEVQECDMCLIYKGGECTFYRMAQAAMSEPEEVAKA